jgi:lysophospholipase L1-like esterase
MKYKYKIILISSITLLVALVWNNIDVLAWNLFVKDDPVIVVSLGDSYSSGEGVEPFYGQDGTRENDPDWIAHRSAVSWASRLTVPGLSGTLADHKDENWFFVAASGATTKELFQSFDKKYGWFKQSVCTLDPQLDIFKNFQKNTVDYVTMTIGGNDVGFSNIISAAVIDTALNTGGVSPVKLTRTINSTWYSFYADGGIREDIKNAYLSVSEKAGSNANIIIAGYPTLLSDNGSGILFSQSEAQIINQNVAQFNTELEKLVNECKSKGTNIYFVSVEDAFSGHEAYSGDPYINGIIILPQSQDLTNSAPSAYSMHPNEKGVQAYADCVQAKIDEISAEPEISADTQENEKTYNTEWLQKKKDELMEAAREKFLPWLMECISAFWEWIKQRFHDFGQWLDTI